MQKIRLLNRKKIDETRWNNCVRFGAANLAYAHCRYLDIICENGWKGLVYGDYEAVFPLPLKKRFGIFSYVVQPKFCQQLGAFGKEGNVSESDFLRAIPWYYLRVRLHLNPYFSNSSLCQTPVLFKTTERTNYILDLGQPVVISKDGLKNIKAVSRFSYRINNISVSKVVELYQKRWGELNSAISEKDYHRFLQGMELLNPTTELTSSDVGYVVVSAHDENHTSSNISNDHRLIGAGLFLFSGKGTTGFSHFVLGAPNVDLPESNGIMHGIIHHAIEHFKSVNLIFDFEGSSISSVAEFYKKFNPTNKPFLYLEKGL
jgi:hypothetical protein